MAGGRFVSVCCCWVEFSVVGLYSPLLGSICCGGAPPHCRLVGFAFTALMLKSFTWPRCGLPDRVLFDMLVLSFETLVLGIQMISGIMVFFRDIPHRPPTSWVPPCIAPSLTPPSSDDELPTSLWKGMGQVWLGQSSCTCWGCFQSGPHPSREGRGLAAWFYAVGRVLSWRGRRWWWDAEGQTNDVGFKVRSHAPRLHSI